ncbi:MAG: hypothetical protein CR984_03715 [Proteobacteria bacterium]|nr:MAG: hypothetical protein CR984_03715 [Pseudomonadota bacterium]
MVSSDDRYMLTAVSLKGLINKVLSRPFPPKLECVINVSGEEHLIDIITVDGLIGTPDMQGGHST